MRLSYGVICRPDLPECRQPHIEDLEGFEVLYLSWQVNNREQGVKRAIWVDEKQERLIKRFQNIYTAKSYLENVEPALLELGCYASEIELEEYKPNKK